MNEPTPEKEIKQLWRDYRFFYRMLLYAVLIGVGVLIGRAIYAAPEADQAWGYGVNLFTGVLSTAATVLILDQLAERRADRKAEESLKEQLKLDAASISNETAKNAVHQLWRKNWLHGENGLLKGENLTSASLQGAVLMGANLQGTDLRTSNLQQANLATANLQGANLKYANLQGTNLIRANLQDADLSEANLHSADLRGAELQRAKLLSVNLYGADLSLANLQHARLGWNSSPNQPLAFATRAKFDETTKLPNGNFWTPETDIRRFTDPEHPDFEPLPDDIDEYFT